MNVQEFINKLNEVATQAFGTGDKSNTGGRHKLPTTVGFECEELDLEFELDLISVDGMYWSCGCETGLTFKLKVIKDEV